MGYQVLRNKELPNIVHPGFGEGIDALVQGMQAKQQKQEAISRDKMYRDAIKREMGMDVPEGAGEAAYGQYLKTKITEPESELDKLLNKGKVADAEMKIFEAGGPSPTLSGLATPPTTPQGTPASLPSTPMSAPSVGSTQSGYKVKTLDAFGRPKGYELIEPTAAQDKRNIETGELENQAKNLIDLFHQARNEAQGGTASPAGQGLEGWVNKNVGQPGFGGRLAGIAAVGRGKAGYSPSVSVYQDKLKAFATTVAKAAGEQRPTDQDIQRFIATMMSMYKNDAENKILEDQLVKDLQAKGAKAVWSERGQGTQSAPQTQTSGTDFATEAEAEAANLPPGTIITINGRKARID